MNYTWRRLGALLLALVMALSLLPGAALAAKGDGELPAIPAEDDGASFTAPAVIEEDWEDRAELLSAAAAEIPVSGYAGVTADSSDNPNHATEGGPEMAIDNNTGKFWHSAIGAGDSAVDGCHWIAVELKEETWVSAFRYKPRSGLLNLGPSGVGNGYVRDYRIDVSLDGATWTKDVASGTWEFFNSEHKKITDDYQQADFAPVRAKFVRLVGVHTVGNNTHGEGAGGWNTAMHANELRVVKAATYTVSGTVRDADGPKAGAVVSAGGVTAAATGADGAFTLELPNGSHTPTVELEGYELAGAAGPIAVNGAEVSGVTLTVAQVVREVKGTVTAGGEPLVGASVRLVTGDTAAGFVTAVAQATTGPDGSYTLNVNGVPTGDYKIRAAKAGYTAALSGEAFRLTAGASQTVTGKDAALTAIDPAAADHFFDMTTSSPTYTTGSTAAARLENGLFMNFSGSSRSGNRVELEGVNAADVTVEFDATRGGSGATGGFGVALRCVDGGYFYVGQDATLAAWRVESVSGETVTPGAAHQGPSFASGETRHFKMSLRREGDGSKVSLWIDGVAVISGETVPAGGPTGLGAVAFLCGVNNTSVTVDDLSVSRTDAAYTITMPATLTGYTVLSGAQTRPLEASGEGEFAAYEGDVVNIYCADPVRKELSAPLNVLKTADDTLSSAENILHVTHSGSANKERGYYVQFQMPAYDVTLEPTLKTVEVKEVAGVSILRSDPGPLVVNVDGAAALRATLTPAKGVEDLGVTWTSSDPAVASVEGPARAEEDGKMDAAYATATVTGHKEGAATITVTTANGKTDTREVTVGRAVENVIFRDNTQVTLYTNPATPSQSTRTTLTPTVNPANATDPALTWWSTDETVVTVDETGLVAAVAPGTAQIWARSKQNPTAQAYRTVEVVTLPEGLTLDVTDVELILSPGTAPGTQVVVPTLTPGEASDKTIRWTTGNANVATVTKPWAATTGSQNAQITAQGVGTAAITATSAANSAVTASLTVTVKQRIVGQASVSGALKFESTLTADVNDIAEAAKSSLTYQWYQGAAATEENAIAGATGKTYVVQEADIGSVLTVKITAGGYYLGETTCTTGAIGKADGYRMEATPTYQNCSAQDARDGKITGLHADRLYEYQPSTEDALTGTWTPVAANSTEIADLAVGTYRVRRAGDDTHLPGSNFETVTVSWAGAVDFDIAIPTTFDGGDVTADIRQAAEGETVTLTVAPDVGYQLAENGLTVKAAGDSPVAVTAVEGAANKFTFRMPNGNVQVEAVFERKSYTIVHGLTHILCSLGAEENHTAVHGERFSVTLTPEEGYEMPRTLTVTATQTGERFSDFTYTAAPGDPASRVLTFANGVTESVTVRGDATLKTFPVEYVRQRVSFTSAPARAGWHQEFVAAVAPDQGYLLPDNITVTMGGSPVAYTYNKENGAVYIAAGLVEDSLTITVEGVKEIVALEKASIAGTAQVGRRLTASVTPAEADGHVNYQWYWVTLDGEGNVDTEELIQYATGRSRVLTEASEGKAIMVEVSAVEGGGFSGTVRSQPTGQVIAADATGVLPDQVQIKRERVSVAVGETDTLVAYVGPANATNKTVLWTTSDPEVVTVENGVITGVAPGTATVTVTAQADEAVTDTCAITVTAPRVVLAEAQDVHTAYDGLPHGIVVAVTNPVDGSAGVTYSSDGVHFHASNPTFSAVGEHVVWYRVTAAGLDDFNGQAKVTIEKAAPAVALTADPAALGGAGTVTLTVTLPDYADRAALVVEAAGGSVPVVRNEDGTYTVELPGDRRTYTFTATLPGTDNYEQTVATCAVRVGPASSGSSGTTKTETREDGAKVTTVTKPDGSKVETVEQADGSKTEAVTSKDGAVTITATDANGEELAKVEIPATIPEPETKFEDLDTVPWAEEAVNNVAALELVKGTGGNKYTPAAPMTRGSLATVLHRLSQGKSDYNVTFKDVAQGKYYTEGVAWAAKANVVKGISEDVFAPDDIITREQLAVMLARYAKLIGMDTKADAHRLNAFADGDSTGEWAVDGVAWCVQSGILKGKGQNNLDPAAEVTRAEVAVMLDRFIALIRK